MQGVYRRFKERIGRESGRLEIAIYGRGGQGAKTAGDLLTRAFHIVGIRSHGQPRYTADRMGAPVSYAIRLSLDGSPIYDRSWVRSPEIAAVFDFTLFEELGLRRMVREDGTIVLNISGREEIPVEISKYKLSFIDANSIARRFGLINGTIPIVGTIMCGAFAKVTGMITLESIISALSDVLRGKPKRILDLNVMAVELGYKEAEAL